MLATAPTRAQRSMFVVETSTTLTHGPTVVREEKNTHTFASSGFRRVDREINGERTTDVTIPRTASADAERIVINHTLGVARRGPLDMLAEGTALALEPSATRQRAVRPGTLRYQAAMQRRAQGEGTPVQYMGQQGFGPLILHHYRAEMPDGVTIEEWRYRFDDGISEITLASESRGIAPDGAPMVQETSILGVVRSAFDMSLFTEAVPATMRLQNLWERVADPSRMRR